MSSESILVVDDEEDILELVRYNLSKARYQVVCATSGEEGLRLARSLSPKLIVLDLMLPGINGLDVCRILKGDAITKPIPIIMLTAKGEDSDVIAGLELGADDYVVKPFSPKVLLARLQAVLRRLDDGKEKMPEILRRNEVVLDPVRYQVSTDGKPLELTSTEFKILQLLASQPGRVYTRYQIVDAVHGEDYPVTDRSVDVQIVGLRRKLGTYSRYIETVRGIGYKFQDSDGEASQ